MIWFASDNRSFLERGIGGGSKSFIVEQNGKQVIKKLKGGKAPIWEGEFRVPGFTVFEKDFPSNVVTDEAVSTMDIFPTIIRIVDEVLSKSKKEYLNVAYRTGKPHTVIDGKDISPLIMSFKDTRESKTLKTPHDFMIHYCGDTLSAVRIEGRYKAYFKTPKNMDPVSEACGKSASCQCEGA